MGYDRARYDELKAAGTCVKCGRRPAARKAGGGRSVHCASCRRYTADWMAAHAGKRNLKDLCARCGKNAIGQINPATGSPYKWCRPCRLGASAARRARSSAAQAWGVTPCETANSVQPPLFGARQVGHE